MYTGGLTRIYEFFRAHPPIKDGRRNRGSTPRDEFWRGYDGHRSLSAPKSWGRAAWKAGRDLRKEGVQLEDRP